MHIVLVAALCSPLQHTPVLCSYLVQVRGRAVVFVGSGAGKGSIAEHHGLLSKVVGSVRIALVAMELLDIAQPL